MQPNLVNNKINKIISLDEYNELSCNEFILYSDNILEGITFLNDLTLNDKYLKLYSVVYQPIDQPIYIFIDDDNKLSSIKICGAYDKWNLPKDVSLIKNYNDLPDYILYSIRNRRVIVAGENTETASVGNSQWQREGRKIGAARIKVPFIYQTFYSGRDESRNTIREPSSLQVYNSLIYTIRYRVLSLVSYLENYYENSSTRKRVPSDSKLLFSDYIKSIIISDYNKSFIATKKMVEEDFLLHMFSYLKETKYKNIDNSITNIVPRLKQDFSCVDNYIYDQIINNPKYFAKHILDYIYNVRGDYSDLIKICNYNVDKYVRWTSYNNKPRISDLLNFVSSEGFCSLSYSYKSKVGFVKKDLIKEYLINKFPSKTKKIDEILSKYKNDTCILMPLRLHKMNNNQLTFSADPESGEIIAFSELFAYDIFGNKKFPIIGYVFVDTPKNFNINDKKGTKLYKAISNYVDILCFDNQLEFDLKCSLNVTNYYPKRIIDEKPLSLTEEMAVVSTYLNQTTINSNWKLCFIHTHHSSWQELVVYDNNNIIQNKINRDDTKVDLVTQKINVFMLAEGKNNYNDIISDKKIQKAMRDTGNKISQLFLNKKILFDAFIYNLSTNPEKDPDFYAEREAGTVEKAFELGHFNDIVYHNQYVVLIVYTNEEYKTCFKLVYSKNFDKNIKYLLDKEFNQ